MHVIEAKTAALFAAACEIGAVVAQRPDAEAEALSRFGRGLGIAFQLVDDVLDYSAEQQALGKTVGDDFREGKVTLPIVLAFNRGDAREQAFWRRTIEDLEQTEADLPHAMTLLEKHGCLRETLDRAERYVADAREAMSVFPDSPTKQALLATLESSLERSA
jgi:octaprenyl-diphosphate synthase